jgi:serine protease Do
MRGLDLTIFDFDYDLSWFALMLTANGQVLGRFGGRDAETPAKYQTLAGLRYSLQDALSRYAESAKEKPTTKPMYAEDYPAAAKKPPNSCIHCHHVYEFRRDHLQSQGRWKVEEVWVHPQPGKIGLTLDLEQGNIITHVQPQSPAAKIRVRAKDQLRRINGIPIASIADVQYALHKAPAKGKLTISWQRGAIVIEDQLSLAENWRKTDVSWRWSLKSMSPSPGVIGDDLDQEERKALGLDLRQLAYRQMNFLPPAARHAGLQANDIILGIDDQVLFMTARQFETHIRLNYRVGQEITLIVLRGKERKALKLKLTE